MELLNLRSFPCELAALHPLLSAQAFLQRHQGTFAEFNLPPTFVGLTFASLQDCSVPLPAELLAQNPVPYLLKLHDTLFFYLFTWSAVLESLLSSTAGLLDAIFCLHVCTKHLGKASERPYFAFALQCLL